MQSDAVIYNTVRQTGSISRVKEQHTRMANRARAACPRSEFPPARRKRLELSYTKSESVLVSSPMTLSRI